MTRIFRREPAVIIGLVISLLSAIADSLTDSGVDWAVVVPAVTGIVTRFFVYAPATVEELGGPSSV